MNECVTYVCVRACVRACVCACALACSKQLKMLRLFTMELIIFAGVFFNSAREYLFFHYGGNANDVFGAEREREKKRITVVPER